MDSSGFQLLAKNFTNLTPQECDQLKELARQHPYSQLIHLIHSRAAQDLKHPDQGELLNQSAVYSSDRSVLKWVMTATRQERILKVVNAPVKPKLVQSPIVGTVPVPKIEEKKQVVVKANPDVTEVSTEPGLDSKTTKAATKPEVNVLKVESKTELSTREVKPEKVTPKHSTSENNLTGDALREDLYRELEKLQKLKHEFEVNIDEFQRAHPFEMVGTKADMKTGKSATEPLLEEIKTTRKKIKIDSPRQKEQNEIIDQFIKAQPSLPKAKTGEPVNDLSEDSGNFSDNVVSETLVDILLKQGKKDKAIEVLKKLIWKFPQKKAYFAAQIEDLKN
jgi:hypothetical protein